MFVPATLKAFLAIVWLTSGIDKFGRPGDGVSLARQLGWAGAVSSHIRAVGVFETALGISWIFASRVAAPVTVIFLVGYTVGLSSLWHGEADMRCACGGVLGSETISWRTFARNGVLLLAAVLVGLSGLHTNFFALTYWFGAAAAGANLALILGATQLPHVTGAPMPDFFRSG